MTRRKSDQATENEHKLQAAIAAIAAIADGTCKTLYEAAKAFQVPKATLYKRAQGRQPCNKAHEQLQILSLAEEKELVRWITQLTVSGYPPRHATLREMAEEIRKQRVKNLNDDSIEYITFEPIGQQWVQRFLQRFPELETAMSRTIDASRVKDPTISILTTWFETFQQTLQEYGIALQKFGILHQKQRLLLTTFILIVHQQISMHSIQLISL